MGRGRGRTRVEETKISTVARVKNRLNKLQEMNFEKHNIIVPRSIFYSCLYCVGLYAEGRESVVAVLLIDYQSLILL